MHKFLKREKPGTEVAITISANERFVSITVFGEIKGGYYICFKKERRRTNLYDSDLLACRYLTAKFKCLQQGTIASRAQNLSEILILLEPPFIVFYSKE